jgi:hypothetical protein
MLTLSTQLATCLSILKEKNRDQGPAEAGEVEKVRIILKINSAVIFFSA